MSNLLGYRKLSVKYLSGIMDLIDKLPQLLQPHVHIKNKDKFCKTLGALIKDGPSKLQVVFDFDQTLTKQHENGKKHLSSFGMFDKCPSLSAEYKKTVDELHKKYYPLEIDPNIPINEKYKLMEEWWNKSEVALKGLKVDQNEIDEVCLKIEPSLRDNTKLSFDLMLQKNIPVLVFSAGLGNTVQTVLKHQSVLLPNVKIISNFLKYNDDGSIEGFINAPIHVFNKNEYAIKNADFYNDVKDRHNVILLGDSLGDASMADGIDHVNTIKIGFLYERREEALPKYLDTFDIVLEDDQTMDVFLALLKCICG